MKVIALQTGFYNGRRVRAGTEFEFDIERRGNIPFKKDKRGNHVLDTRGAPQRDLEAPRELPKWVLPASSESRELLAQRQQAAVDKAHDAALTAAGEKERKQSRADSWLEVL